MWVQPKMLFRRRIEEEEEEEEVAEGLTLGPTRQHCSNQSRLRSQRSNSVL